MLKSTKTCPSSNPQRLQQFLRPFQPEAIHQDKFLLPATDNAPRDRHSGNTYSDGGRRIAALGVWCETSEENAV